MEKAIDIRSLLRTTGFITLDSGYMNTGSCESGITYLDGENGILRYRGYDIADLAENCTFIEVAYLILYGELPTADELGLPHAAVPPLFAGCVGYLAYDDKFFYAGFRFADPEPFEMPEGA